MLRNTLALLVLTSLIAACSSSKNIPAEPIEYVVADTIYVSSPKPVEETEVTEELPVYRATQTRAFDLLHTGLKLRFNFEEQTVIGSANLKLTPYFYATNVLVLDARSFEVSTVKLTDSGKSLNFNNDGQQLSIDLERTYERTDTVNIQIDYIARPNEGPEGGSAAIQSDKGLFFINPTGTDPGKPTQIWTQGETEHNSRWFPTLDQPNERCTQDIVLTVPENLTSLSNGLLVLTKNNNDGTRTDRWVMNDPHAPYLFMLAIGEYAVVEESWKELPVSYYVEPHYEDDAKNIFGHTPEMLTFFSDKLGYPYPWNKYAQVVVRDYVSGAMENTTAVTFGEFVQQETEDLIDNHNDRIVAHEMFHHWFGDLVTCESWSNLTMNEGFANYAEYLWLEYKYGKDEAELHRLTELQGYLQESKSNPHDLIHFGYDNKEDMFDRHSYNKGGLILHMLRKYLGDEAFYKSLNRYLNDNAFDTGEAHQLRLAVEAITGQDWNWFFNQWFYGTGHPIVSQKYTYNSDSSSIKLTLEQIQDPEVFEPIFIVPMSVRIAYADGRSMLSRIVFEERAQTFEIPIDGDVLWVNVDPGKHMLIEFSDNLQGDPIKIYQAASEPIDRLYAMGSAFRQSSPELMGILPDFLKDDLWLIRYYALNLINSIGANDFQPSVRSMALSDPNANIRGFAASLMVNDSVEQVKSICTSILANDSSSLAKSSALNSLNEVAHETALAWAQRMTKSNSPSILEVVGSVFAKDAKSNHLDYFKAISTRLPDNRVSVIFDPWLNYALNSNFAMQNECVDTWLDIASDEDRGFNIRTDAYGTLGAFKDEIDSEAAMNEETASLINRITEARMNILKSSMPISLKERLLNQ